MNIFFIQTVLELVVHSLKKTHELSLVLMDSKQVCNQLILREGKVRIFRAQFELVIISLFVKVKITVPLGKIRKLRSPDTLKQYLLEKNPCLIQFKQFYNIYFSFVDTFFNFW